MKKIILPAALVMFVALSACEKCADCACANTVELEFDSDFSGDKDAVETGYANGVNNTYPANDGEICGKKKELEADIADYESESRTITDEPQNAGYTATIVRECTCVEQ